MPFPAIDQLIVHWFIQMQCRMIIPANPIHYNKRYKTKKPYQFG
jgi:hypothetical protein